MPHLSWSLTFLVALNLSSIFLKAFFFILVWMKSKVDINTMSRRHLWTLPVPGFAKYSPVDAFTQMSNKTSPTASKIVSKVTVDFSECCSLVSSIFNSFHWGFEHIGRMTVTNKILRLCSRLFYESRVFLISF